MTIEDTIKQAVEAAVRDAVKPLVAALQVERGEWVSVQTAAGLTETSADTIEKWVSEGHLRLSVEGRVRRIRKAELQAFMESRLAGAPDPKARSVSDRVRIKLEKDTAAAQRGNP